MAVTGVIGVEHSSNGTGVQHDIEKNKHPRLVGGKVAELHNRHLEVDDLVVRLSALSIRVHRSALPDDCSTAVMHGSADFKLSSSFFLAFGRQGQEEQAGTNDDFESSR
ncbi:hypothetical protein M378DRAFT_15561 [Amanita muscaria Koide BX008]|uniref:Uncharacterized protein n=1 Tax=Amanita muscaria (strain Koide BX008) TaxID=946122 RepID=A0A0C2S6U2_AMAMK|nr:hypothetical protein M378DRAFT_15561 [Amanita muscaria Koide BX008]